MKKLVLSLALVLAGSFAIGQELTKEQIKEQKKQIMGFFDQASRKFAEVQKKTGDTIAVYKIQGPSLSS